MFRFWTFVRLGLCFLFVWVAFFVGSPICADISIESPLVKEWIDAEVKKQVGNANYSTTPGVRMDHFLKSKLFGATVWYSDSDGNVVGRGVVQSVVKRGDGYEVSVYDTLLKSVVLLQVVFQGTVGTGPTLKRRELEISQEMARKRTYEAEKQLSVSLSPLVSGDGGSSAALSTTFEDPVVEPYPSGEDMLVSDVSTGERKIMEVTIYKGFPLLSDGTPLQMRLERI